MVRVVGLETTSLAALEPKGDVTLVRNGYSHDLYISVSRQQWATGIPTWKEVRLWCPSTTSARTICPPSAPMRVAVSPGFIQDTPVTSTMIHATSVPPWGSSGSPGINEARCYHPGKNRGTGPGWPPALQSHPATPGGWRPHHKKYPPNHLQWQPLYRYRNPD